MYEYMIECKDKKGKWDPIGLSVKARDIVSANKKVNGLIKRGYITEGKFRARKMKK